jgi:hypothetical protein
MDAVKGYMLEKLRTAREEVQALQPEDLTHAALNRWMTKWHSTAFIPANLLQGVVHSNSYPRLLSGHEDAPYAVLYEIRVELVKMVDATRGAIDASQAIPDLLQENIARVADPKLSTLLNEFRTIKDAAPSSAGVILRTILICIIHQRAKAKHATGELVEAHQGLATKTNFDLQPMIDKAIQAHIFDASDEKFLKLFSPSGKAVFDNVAHSVGSTALVDKDHLATMIEPLNKLLTYVRI